MKEWEEDGRVVFHEHDLRTKVASDTSLENAQAMLDHASSKITGTVYRVKPKVLKLDGRKALKD